MRELLDMADILIVAAYLVVLGLISTKDSMVCMLSFTASAVFMWAWGLPDSPLGNAFVPEIDHLIVSLIFIPAIIVCSKMVSLACICYALFQWLTAGEYLFFDTTNFFIGSFVPVTAVLNLMIMAALVYDRHNYDYDKDSLLANSWIINLCCHYLQNSSHSKSGKSQC